MNLSAILNMDMGTMRAGAVRAVHWWLAELALLVPGRLRPVRRSPGQLLLWQGGALTAMRRGVPVTTTPASGSRVTLAVPARLALMRTLQLPRMSGAALHRLVEIEAERLSPLPTAESLVGMDWRLDHGAGGATQVDVAVLPRRVAEEGIAATDEARLTVAAFGLMQDDERSVRFDFMPALREHRLVAQRRSTAGLWWAVAAALGLLNVAVVILRDQQSVDQLQAAVDQQRPAVAAARSLQSRASSFERAARELASQRRAHDVVGSLALVSQKLPQGAWVQRYSDDGSSVRLIGYKSRTVDLVAILRKDPAIAGLRSNSAQLVTDSPAGQPFDVTLFPRAGR